MHHDDIESPLPEHWSPEQALAVVEFLEYLAIEIWSHYGPAIYNAHPNIESAHAIFTKPQP